jgi:hypothetical protein
VYTAVTSGVEIKTTLHIYILFLMGLKYMNACITNKLHGADAFFEKLIVTQSRNSLSFMEGSLPCSQEPVTGPCPELDAFSPHLPTLFP